MAALLLRQMKKYILMCMIIKIYTKHIKIMNLLKNESKVLFYYYFNDIIKHIYKKYIKQINKDIQPL